MKKLTDAAVAMLSAAALTLAGSAAVVPALLNAPADYAYAVDDGNDDWLHAEGSRL